MNPKNTILIIALLTLLFYGCKTGSNKPKDLPPTILETKPFTTGIPVIINVIAGQEYKFPIIAIWLESDKGEFLGNLLVSQSIATGIFRYGEYRNGKWHPGERTRPAALPRWKNLSRRPESHQEVDAYTGATPPGTFVLKTILPEEPSQIRVVLEVNRPWDFNNYWHNNRFPNDEEFKTSGQPALIYQAVVDRSTGQTRFELRPVGHSHPSGADATIFESISTFTSALKIIDSAWIEIMK